MLNETSRKSLAHLGLFQIEQQLINRHLVPKSQPKKPKHYCHGRGRRSFRTHSVVAGAAIATQSFAGRLMRLVLPRVQTMEKAGK